MKTVRLYVVRQIFVPLFATAGVALLALLLERMLRLMDFTGNSEGSFVLIFKMLINLVPHYLGVALPAAFFLGVLLSFNRLARDNELVALNALGFGLHRLLAPIMALAIAFTILAGIVIGFLQPYGRYAYRALIHVVTHATLSAALHEGVFVQVGDTTFMAERVTSDRKRLSKVFVHEEKDDGRSITTTARNGMLLGSGEDLRPVLHLIDGDRVSVRGSDHKASVLKFNEMRRPIGEPGKLAFRDRGNDESELTSIELWSARRSPPGGATTEEINAEFHARLVRTASILFLPLLAIPLGLGAGRGRRSYEIAVGLLILIVYQKVLQFGESLTSLGEISPWLGLWLPLVVFAAGSGYLFCRASFRVSGDPLSALVDRLAEGGERLGDMLPRRKS